MAVETETFLVCDYINVDRLGKPILFGVYPRTVVHIPVTIRVLPTLGILWIVEGLPVPTPSATIGIQGPFDQILPARSVPWHPTGLEPTIGVLLVGIQGLQLTGVEEPIVFTLSLEEGTILTKTITLHFLSENGDVVQ